MDFFCHPRRLGPPRGLVPVPAVEQEGNVAEHGAAEGPARLGDGRRRIIGVLLAALGIVELRVGLRVRPVVVAAAAAAFFFGPSLLLLLLLSSSFLRGGGGSRGSLDGRGGDERRDQRPEVPQVLAAEPLEAAVREPVPLGGPALDRGQGGGGALAAVSDDDEY